jgi:tripartite-type tricarboxylate transporter receptor subunit TctC
MGHPAPPFGRRAALALGAAALPRGASAQGVAARYPSGPVRLLVGFSPGGALDLLARPLAQRLSERLGQPFLVENRAGAAGNLAAEAAARAAPDGHVLLMAGHSTLAVPRPSPAFDAARDLAPVAQVAVLAFVLAVPADLPARSVADLLALARARPGGLNAGTSGVGGLQHLALELLKRRAGVDIAHVPFRGAADVARELVAGRVELGVDPYGSFQAGVEAGRLRVLATTAAARLPALPGVPAVAEAPGLQGYEATGFAGVVAPAATPRAVVEAVEAAVAWAMGGTDLPRAYERQGALPRHAGAREFAALAARDRERWGRLMSEAGIALDCRRTVWPSATVGPPAPVALPCAMST